MVLNFSLIQLPPNFFAYGLVRGNQRSRTGLLHPADKPRDVRLDFLCNNRIGRLNVTIFSVDFLLKKYATILDTLIGTRMTCIH